MRLLPDNEMKTLFFFFFYIFYSAIVFGQNKLPSKYKTQHVIVIVIDGPRYSETWGDESRRYIPRMVEMSKRGVVCTNFYNDGHTYTSSGHAAISSGFKQALENKKGIELPQKPSFLQYYLKKTQANASKAWIITSKEKLWILANCHDSTWKDQYTPSYSCGKADGGIGQRHDSLTFQKIMTVLKQDKPNLMLINFREPDHSGHKNDWKNYLKGIQDTDSLTWEIWKYIQKDSYYKDKTTLFVTNDHGRHLDGIKDGFVNHGDDCEGCRHINLYAFGPDFKENTIVNQRYVQVDISATIAELLGFTMPHGQGKVMESLFYE